MEFDSEMEYDKKGLKNKLMEIARQQAAKFGEDMTKEMKKNVKLEKDDTEKWVKIIYIGKDIKRNPINKESFEQLLGQLSPDGKVPAYQIVDDVDSIQFKFEDREIVAKVYDHYNNFFFGTLQENIVNDYLLKYITEMIDEGCATGACSHTHLDDSCGCGSCGTSCEVEDPDKDS